MPISSSQTLSVQERYAHAIARQDLSYDAGQAAAITRLDSLYQQIKQQQAQSQQQGFLQKIWHKRPPPIKGVYLYGGVGRGKTMLMDMFAETFADGQGQRFHFHEFMTQAHDEMQSARAAGAHHPIDRTATRLLAPGKIICFDEMEIRDIADAMIIRRLFESLWHKGMILVATSNRIPEELYLQGLHRERFLPFITALRANMAVHEIAGGLDWRAQNLQNIACWHVIPPKNPKARKVIDQKLDEIFCQLTKPQQIKSESVTVAGRNIFIEKASAGIADLSFADICGKPLAARDYLALSNRFTGLILRDIPIMGEDEQNEARRFIWLVDAFYDRGRFMLASAEAPADKIYKGTRWTFEFNRTASRLAEMARF